MAYPWQGTTTKHPHGRACPWEYVLVRAVCALRRVAR